MRAFVIALAGLLAAQTALACRGPFSGPDQWVPAPGLEIYLGRVKSVAEVSGIVITTLSVERAWQPHPPKTVSIEGVGMQAPDPMNCVRFVAPAVNERWLVVAHRFAFAGSSRPPRLVAARLQTFRVRDVQVPDMLLKERGKGFAP